MTSSSASSDVVLASNSVSHSVVVSSSASVVEIESISSSGILVLSESTSGVLVDIVVDVSLPEDKPKLPNAGMAWAICCEASCVACSVSGALPRAAS